MGNRYVREVRQLHQFFQAWFAGEIENTDAGFGRFSQTVADTFTLIGPGGDIKDCATMKAQLRAAHGSGAFQIWIENPQVQALSDTVTLVLYEEWQIRNGVKTARQSSALFRPKADAPNAIEWLHVHETWINEHLSSS